MKRGPKPITERFTIEELLGMRDNGMSNYEIAEVVGCSYATVHHYIGKSGIRKKAAKTRPVIFDIDAEEIRKRRENGETMVKIAKDIGCSRWTLYKRLGEAKLKVESEEKTETDFPLTMKSLKWAEETVNLITNDKRRCWRHYTITNTNGAIDITIQTSCENNIIIDRDEIGELIVELREIRSYIEHRWGEE